MSGFTTDFYVRREVTPAALDWLADNLCKHFKRPRVAAGTVGDPNHRNGYHRSQEFLLRSSLSTNASYSIESGLTAEQARWVSALDFTPATAAEMILISKRIHWATRAGLLEGVVEWYGNLGGDNRVDGWDNIRNRIATSDQSHMWHLHLSFRRKLANDRKLMQTTFNVLTTGHTVAQKKVKK